ncbi:MAG: hypothetical protein IJX78_00145 [Bacilli bacterium]|nr:hypothetical protein [Bacilli bacterium]
MRTYKNLFDLKETKPVLEEYLIGYTKIYLYQSIDYDEEIFFSKRIASLFKLMIYTDYLLFWFSSFDEMYERLGSFLEIVDDNCLKIIVIIN